MDFYSVKTIEELHNIINPLSGSIYYCEENHQEYYYDKQTKEWNVIPQPDELIYTSSESEAEIINTTSSGMTIYDLNKMAIAQMPVMTKEQIADRGRKSLEAFYNYEVGHYMLLCKDLSYYTVFEAHDNVKTHFIDAVLEIVYDLGAIHDMFINDDGVMEFWIRPEGDEEVYAFFLFPYDLGVVYYA